MRFMRGLDLHKLRQNIAHLYRRLLLFYPEWRERRSRTLPTTLLLEADAPELPTRRRVASGALDVVVFHSCAWGIPRVNPTVRRTTTAPSEGARKMRARGRTVDRRLAAVQRRTL